MILEEEWPPAQKNLFRDEPHPFEAKKITDFSQQQEQYQQKQQILQATAAGRTHEKIARKVLNHTQCQEVVRQFVEQGSENPLNQGQPPQTPRNTGGDSITKMFISDIRSVIFYHHG